MQHLGILGVIVRTALVLLVSTAFGQQSPLLVIGIDGFRPDYLIRHSAPRIAAFARTGASAASLVPQFPSTTFPNFYSIATGLTPEQHGIIDMDFHDSATGKRFYYRDSASQVDPAWWGGTPIWVAAEKAGLPTATYFWVGSDREIQGVKPKWHYAYNPRVTREQKVKQVIEWLHMPAKEQPRLVMVYFSDVDGAAHANGPLAPQVKEAVANVDAAIGQLLDGIRDVKPAPNVMMVSDHGMSAVQQSIDLTPLADFSGFRVSNSLPLTQLYAKDAALVEATYQRLKGKSPMWSVYKRAEIPKHLGLGKSERVGDLVIIPNGPYMIAIGQEIPNLRGMHGYDPSRFLEMHGILFASGPAFRSGASTGAIQNTALYALFRRLLGLKAEGPIDSRLRSLLR